MYKSIFVWMNCIVMAYATNTKLLSDVPGINKWIIIRGIIGSMCFMLYTFAVTKLPLSLLMIIFQTSPFWTSILAYFINNERIYKLEYASMALCFLGVCVVAFAKDQKPNNHGFSEELLGIAAIFIMSWLYAGGNVLSRRLKDIPNLQIVF